MGTSQRPYVSWTLYIKKIVILTIILIFVSGFWEQRKGFLSEVPPTSLQSEQSQSIPQFWQCLLGKGNPWPKSIPFKSLDKSGRYIHSVPTLDGGGREIILSLLNASSSGFPVLLIEVGIFMGGSALTWLQRKNLYYYGVDISAEDANDWRARYIESEKWLKFWFDENKDASKQYLANLGQQNGYKYTLESTLWQHRHRTLLHFDGCPRGLQPLIDCFMHGDRNVQVVFYLDSDKEYYEMYLIYLLWPSALITGDDWTFGDGTVQVKLCTLSKRLDLTIFEKDATWVALKNDQLQWKDAIILSGGKICDCQALAKD